MTRLSGNNSTDNDNMSTPISLSYESMIPVYQRAYQTLKEAERRGLQASDTNVLSNQELEQWNKVMELLDRAINDILPANARNHVPPLLPPFPTTGVLVHLDLQSQNLLFRHNSQVSSVLDWEDAALADPRFELLLLGRKVCANREQAEQVWSRYSNAVLQQPSPPSQGKGAGAATLGPLRPWLQLETVHSLLTLLLQSTDLLNGGRNPWESSRDLRGKIQREMTRWQLLLDENS